MRQPIFAANWKMHKTVSEAVALADAVRARVSPRYPRAARWLNPALMMAAGFVVSVLIVGDDVANFSGRHEGSSLVVSGADALLFAIVLGGPLDATRDRIALYAHIAAPMNGCGDCLDALGLAIADAVDASGGWGPADRRVPVRAPPGAYALVLARGGVGGAPYDRARLPRPSPPPWAIGPPVPPGIAAPPPLQWTTRFPRAAASSRTRWITASGRLGSPRPGVEL